jgi:hypothetical protein
MEHASEPFAEELGQLTRAVADEEMKTDSLDMSNASLGSAWSAAAASRNCGSL